MIARVALLICVATSVAAQAPASAAPAAPQVYLDFQVDKTVVPSAKNRPPAYPRLLRSTGVEGQVLAKFVVDSTGRVVVSTFESVKADHPLFIEAVKDALP